MHTYKVSSNWLYIINASLLLNTFILTCTLKVFVDKNLKILCQSLIVNYKQSYLFLNYLLLMKYVGIKFCVVLFNRNSIND